MFKNIKIKCNTEYNNTTKINELTSSPTNHDNLYFTQLKVWILTAKLHPIVSEFKNI